MFSFFCLPLDPPPEVETETPAIFHHALQPDHEGAFMELSVTRRAAAATDSTCVFAASCSRLEAKKKEKMLSDSSKTLSSGGAEWTGPHGHHVKKKKKKATMHCGRGDLRTSGASLAWLVSRQIN